MRKDVKSLAEIADSCTGCGLCLPSCPTYAVQLRETLSPRGRMTLVSTLAREGLKSSAAINSLYTCVLCGACLSACPVGVQVVDAVLGARALLMERGVEPPEAYREAARSMVRWGNPLRAPSKQPRRARQAEAEVAVFPGCIVRHRLGELLRSVEAILDSAGVKYTVLMDEICCGAELYRSGYVALARETAKKNLEILQSIDAKLLITLCPHCQWMFTKIYASLAGSKALHSMHFTQFVDMLIDQGRLSLRGGVELKIAYHDPCLLSRFLGVYQEPRRALSSVPGLRLIELRRAGIDALCCGGGSLYSRAYPELSAEMAKNRLREFLSVDADVLVTACPHCYELLVEVAKSHYPMVVVADISEVLAEALKP